MPLLIKIADTDIFEKTPNLVYSLLSNKYNFC